MAHEHFTQEIDESIRLRPPRPSLRESGALAVYLGLGAVGTVLGTAYGAFNYSREHHIGQRFFGSLRNLGNQALSALGEFSGPNDGVCLTDTSTSMGYVVQEAAVPPIPQTQRDTGEVV